jgi:2-methylcitrate dehydratase PrpD
MTTDSVLAVSATDLLADFVVEFGGGGRLSEAERSVAKTGLLDSLGVAVAGSHEDAGRIAAGYARAQGITEGGAQVWGHGFRTAPSIAALANGTAAHALDFDDVNWALVGHPSASLTPTVLALGEMRGSTGSEMLAAYACGFEVMTKIGRTCMPAFSLDGGWHATSAIGTIGTAGAAAYLLGLTRDQVRNAIGVAVSQASGVVRNFGSMTKPFHAGMAAQAGIQAACLAEQGFTSAVDSMEGKHGFYRTLARGLEVDLSWLEKLGSPSELESSGLVVKPYPCGVAGHPAIDAALELRDRLAPGDLKLVTSIEIHATSYTIDKMRYSWPENELQAKFSLHYQVAKALIDGAIELRHFSDAALDDELARQLVDVSTVHLDEGFERDWRRDGGSRPCRVILTFSDGRRESAEVRVSRGNPGWPLTDAELDRKFIANAAPVLGDDISGRVVEMVRDIENLPGAKELCELLSGSAAARER